jgi:hypothetical protein
MLSTFFQINGVEKNKDTTPPFPDSGIGRRSYIYTKRLGIISRSLLRLEKPRQACRSAWISRRGCELQHTGFLFLPRGRSLVHLDIPLVENPTNCDTKNRGWVVADCQTGNGLRRRPCRTIRDLTPCGISSAQPRRCGFLNGKNGLCK